MPDDRGEPPRRRQQQIEVDAGVVAHTLQHVDDVFGTDVAGRARRKRATAQSAETAFEADHAGGEPCENVGEPHAPRIVKVQRQRQIGPALPHDANESFDAGGVRHAGCVAEGYPGDAEIDVARDAIDDLRVGYDTFERTAKGSRDRADGACAAAAKNVEHVAKAIEGLRDAAPHVGAVVRLRCRHDHHDFIDVGRQRPLRTTRIRDQCDVGHGWIATDTGHDFGRVAQIRHRLGRHERCGFDLGDTGCGQQVDQLDLALGGNEIRFDLQAVARDDVMDVYALVHMTTS